MSERQQIESKLREFVTAELLEGVEDDELTSTTNLMARGLIDSISIVSFRVFIERTFQILLPDDTPDEEFSSIASVADLIERLRGPR